MTARGGAGDRVRRRAPGTTRRRLAILPLLAAAACGDPPTAPLPSDARGFTPPAVYARWWAMTEACSGRAPVSDAVRWFSAPGDSIRMSDGKWVGGYYEGARNRIVVAEHWRANGSLVRHEMLHALIGPNVGGHPAADFQGRCGGWVACPPVGCAEEGVPFAPPPANAPVLGAAELELSVEVLPGTVTRVPGDSGAAVVVRVTNPRPVPVWVQLRPPEGCGWCPEIASFGYGIRWPGSTDVGQSAVSVTGGVRFPLEAGGTKLEVFDVDLAGYQAGAYAVAASFNDGDLTFTGPRAVATTFRIAR